jgi:hypothetical protein
MKTRRGDRINAHSWCKWLSCPQMLDGEALELLALGYRKVFFAELYSLVSSQTWPRVNV